MSSTLTDRFFKRGSEFLGVKYPILCGAMTWVSEPGLVAAVSNAGGMGCLAGGNTPVDILEKQIEETKQLTDKPFALNVITVAPSYQSHLELIKKSKIPIVIFAGGIPKGEEIAMVKETGAKVICFGGVKSLANRMLKYGADALIIEGTEAGGHIGPVSLTVLLQDILFEFGDKVPVFVAGGLATGKLSAHMFTMGAAGIQLGTRFAIAEESKAHPEFKKKFLKANARDAVSTPQIDNRLPVIPVRALKNKGGDEFTKLQIELIKKIDANEIDTHGAQLELEKFWMGALRNAVVDGDVDSGSLMAGQSVGLIKKSQPVSEIIDELVSEMTEEFETIKKRIG